MDIKQASITDFIGEIPKGSYRPLVQYKCTECDVKKTEFKIIPKFKCPKCGFYMDALELEGDRNTNKGDVENGD